MRKDVLFSFFLKPLFWGFSKITVFFKVFEMIASNIPLSTKHFSQIS